ncbi:MAG: ABC transporter permease [Paludibacter sp.]|nr:ABC transporter permease [Paludibacter sp.]
MNGAHELTILSMIMTAVLLLVPILVFFYLKMGIIKNLLISTVRMTIQLLLIGFFLEFLFKLNHWAVNLAWFMVMITVAMFATIKNSQLQVKHFARPVLISFVLSNLFIVIYFNFFIVRLNYIFDAKYLIAIGGMVLGNSLRANVVGLGDFYKMVKRDEQLYYYRLSLGAGRFEALMPFIQRSFKAAINPTLANMSTMGIVSLPGMMTGQILGGSVPLEAIKYQLAIMVAIIAATVISIGLSILLTVGSSFDKYGRMKTDILVKKQN